MTLSVAVDEERRFGVLIAAPPFAVTDWATYCDTIAKLNAQIPPGARPILLQILRDGLTTPNAAMRQRMAELRATIPTSAINAVVHETAAMRMIGVALDWLHKPHYASKVVADIPAALRFIEAQMPGQTPYIRALITRAENDSTADGSIVDGANDENQQD